jgi:hypothetical protein
MTEDKNKKGNDRELYHYLVSNEIIAPSRSVAPHYESFFIMTVLPLFKVTPANKSMTKIYLLRQDSLSSVIFVVILTQITFE